ncbi:hypothetical protein VLK31_17960 [Variovorax sp. H27-G14]|uniref:hypothetical protein n=1 Tax=Variovorax sp. H27-G14 TaxID=3111914 RepID=UPI0038FC6473
MSLFSFLSLLGADAADARLVALLEEHGVRRRPEKPAPFKSPYEVLFRLSKHGICLSFQDLAYVENRPPRQWGNSTLQLRAVTVTAGVQARYLPYTGEMPYGIAWADTRQQVRERMAQHHDKLHAYLRDCWWFGERYMSLTYQPGELTQPERPGVFDLTFGLFEPPSALVQQASYPGFQTLVALFGKSMGAPEFQQAFASFDVENWRAESEDGHLDRRRAFGFELYFDPARPAEDGTPSFAGANLTRERLGPSREWKGTLPFGLHFDDTPPVLRHKVPAPPLAWDDGMVVWNFAKWALPQMDVRVNCDTVRNRIECIALLAPGYLRRNESA